MSAAPVDLNDPALEQAMRALQGANHIRSERAKLKRDLKAAKVRLRDILAAGDYEPWLAGANVYGLVRSSPKYGKVKADALFRVCRISQRKTLEGLSGRQRGALLTFMRDFAPARQHGRGSGSDASAQNMTALADANAARLDRAEIKALIESRRRSVASVLEARLHATETMLVAELLCAQFRWGPRRAARLMVTLDLPDTKTVGTLTDRQRRVLVEALDER